jgi:hypothetical protein
MRFDVYALLYIKISDTFSTSGSATVYIDVTATPPNDPQMGSGGGNIDGTWSANTGDTYTAANGTDRIVIALITADSAISGVQIGGVGATTIENGCVTGGDSCAGAFYRVIGTGSGENMNVTSTAGANPSVGVASFQGTHQTTPIYASAIASNDTGLCTLTNVNVEAEGRAFYLINSNQNQADNMWSTPTADTWTELYDANTGSNNVVAAYRNETTAATPISFAGMTRSAASNRSVCVSFSLSSN